MSNNQKLGVVVVLIVWGVVTGVLGHGAGFKEGAEKAEQEAEQEVTNAIEAERKALYEETVRWRHNKKDLKKVLDAELEKTQLEIQRSEGLNPDSKTKVLWTSMPFAEVALVESKERHIAIGLVWDRHESGFEVIDAREVEGKPLGASPPAPRKRWRW